MNLHLLRMLVAVAESQSFSRAAEALFVSQSAVSKGVRELEHQLGLPLLERSGRDNRGIRGVTLTDDGRALVEHGRAIFGIARRAEEEIRERLAVQRGRLRIGASTTVASYWLPAPLGALLQQHPQLQVEWLVGNTRDIADALTDSRIDVGFVEGRVDTPTIDARSWRQERLHIVAPAGQAPADIAALLQQRWLLREPGSGTRQVTDALLARLDGEPAATLQIGSNEAIARAVAEGCGVALLPEVLCTELVAHGRIHHVNIPGLPQLTRPLFRLELRDRPRSPALAAFLASLDGAAV